MHISCDKDEPEPTLSLAAAESRAGPNLQYSSIYPSFKILASASASGVGL